MLHAFLVSICRLVLSFVFFLRFAFFSLTFCPFLCLLIAACCLLPAHRCLLPAVCCSGACHPPPGNYILGWSPSWYFGQDRGTYFLSMFICPALRSRSRQVAFALKSRRHWYNFSYCSSTCLPKAAAADFDRERRVRRGFDPRGSCARECTSAGARKTNRDGRLLIGGAPREPRV